MWRYDLEHNVISLGWNALGDVSKLNEEQLRELVDRIEKDGAPRSRKYTVQSLWNFYHSIKAGDRVIARAGLKKIAGLGTVIGEAYYDREKNAGVPLNNHLNVQWTDECRGKPFSKQVFSMLALYQIDEQKFRTLTESDPSTEQQETSIVDAAGGKVEDTVEFALEKYLEDFVFSNFDAIFKGKLRLYSDTDEGVVGRQFDTGEVGIIDILAQDTVSNALVVFELKKGRESDKVVGQVLRYMGWVSKNLCKPGQDVRGIVISKKEDTRLSYAIQMLKNVELKYYTVAFTLSDHSPS